VRGTERAHLLRGVAARQDRLEVRPLSLVRRHAARELVVVARVLRRDDPERDVADRDEREQDRLERREREHDPDRRDDAPDQAEKAVDDLERAELPLRACARELVVEVGRLEREQVDPRRDVEHPLERAPSDELREHACLLRLDRAREVERDRDQQQGGELRRDARQVARPARAEDRVEQRLRDQELRRDSRRRDELQRRRDHELAPAGAPDEPERVGEQAREVSEAPALLRVHHLPPRLPPPRTLLRRRRAVPREHAHDAVVAAA